MSLVGHAAASMQSALGPELDPLGRKTGVIRRQRKFSGASLLRMLVLTLMRSPNPKPDDFVKTAAQFHIAVTAEAIEKRFNDRLLVFLRASLEHVLGHVVAADPVAIPLLNKFTAVTIGDSTSITLPDVFAVEFPGCGGKAGSGKAVIKIQVDWDLRSGRFAKLELSPGRHTDAKCQDPNAPVTPGSLTIRDLGYFSLKRFRK